MAQVLVVDDHQLLAGAVCAALQTAGIDAEALAPLPLSDLASAIVGRRPMLVLLDLDLGPIGDSTVAIGALTDAGVRVLVVSGIEDPLHIAPALEQGAIGYQSKAESLDMLVETTRRALACEALLDPFTRMRLLEELRRARSSRSSALAPFQRLTEREQETLRALASGRSVREIAGAWFVSEATMRTHVRTLLHKLGAHSQLAAVAMAMRAGWLGVGDLDLDATG